MFRYTIATKIVAPHLKIRYDDIDDYFGKVAHSNIRRCLKGVTKKAYGFTWKEIDA